VTAMKTERALAQLLSLRREVTVVAVIAGKPVTAMQRPHVEAIAKNARTVLDRLAAHRVSYAVETRSSHCFVSSVSYKVRG